MKIEIDIESHSEAFVSCEHERATIGEVLRRVANRISQGDLVVGILNDEKDVIRIRWRLNEPE